jgi:hypothetical protein
MRLDIGAIPDSPDLVPDESWTLMPEPMLRVVFASTGSQYTMLTRRPGARNTAAIAET